MLINKLIELEQTKQIILVAPLSYQKTLMVKLADRTNRLVNIKYMTLENLLKGLTIDYEHDTIFYLMNKYHFNYDVAKVYLQQLQLLSLLKEDTLNLSEKNKYLFLQEIKADLQKANLIKDESTFKLKLKNKYLIIWGYFTLTKKDKKILEEVNYEFWPLTRGKEMVNEANEFQTFNEEIAGIAEKIAELISQGVSLSQIKIVGETTTNKELLNHYFKLYHLPWQSTNKSKLNHYPITKEVLTKYLDKTLDETYVKSLSESSYEIYQQVIAIINNEIKIISNNQTSRKLLENYLEMVLNNTNYKKNCDIEAIASIEIDEALFNENNYLFLINFNQGVYPFIHNDDDYFKDVTKLANGLDDSLEMNSIEKNKIIFLINSPNKVFISYHLLHNEKPVFPSPLINELSLKKLPKVMKISKYANEYNLYQLSCLLDQFLKYGKVSNELMDLLATYKMAYNDYDNSYKGIDLTLYHKLMNNKLKISYTSLNSYYNCAFNYYVNTVLNIDEFSNNFNTYYGKIVHGILAKVYDDDFDFEKTWGYWQENQDYKLSLSEQFFTEILKDKVKELVNLIIKQEELIIDHETMYEKEVKKEWNLELNEEEYAITLKGTIDKVLYHQIKDEVNQTIKNYITIIDYKTGYFNTSIEKVGNGLNLQLPMYLYLAKQISELKGEIIVSGFYYQNVDLSDLLEIADDKKLKAIMWDGYTNIDTPMDGFFGIDYDENSLIKGFKLNKDGSLCARAKVISENQLNLLLETVKQKVDSGCLAIIKGEFMINPKRDEKDRNISCKYCQYEDLCFKNYRNEVKLNDEDEDEGDDYE